MMRYHMLQPMLFRLFILPQVSVSDPRPSYMGETLGDYILGQKIEKFQKMAKSYT